MSGFLSAHSSASWSFLTLRNCRAYGYSPGSLMRPLDSLLSYLIRYPMSLPACWTVGYMLCPSICLWYIRKTSCLTSLCRALWNRYCIVRPLTVSANPVVCFCLALCFSLTILYHIFCYLSIVFLNFFVIFIFNITFTKCAWLWFCSVV